jgi:hypothetical protein
MAFNTNFFSSPRRRKNPFSVSNNDPYADVMKKEQLNQSPPFNPNSGVFGSSGQSTSYTPGIGGGPGQNEPGGGTGVPNTRRNPFTLSRPNVRDVQAPLQGVFNRRGPGAGIPGGDGGWNQNPSGNQGGGPPWTPNPGNPPGTVGTEINPRQNPNFPGHQPPQGDGPVVGPNRQGWQNYTNVNAQNNAYWRPEWMDGTQSEQDVLDWYNTLNDMNSENFGAAFQDLLSYGTGALLPFADARTQRRMAQTLDMNREQDIAGNDMGAGVFGVGMDQFGLDQGVGYGQADRGYNSRERYASVQQGLQQAMAEILGLAGGGTGMSNDNNENDLLEGFQSFTNNMLNTAQQYAQPGGGISNRYSEGRRNEDMAALLASVEGTPMEAWAGVLGGIVNPEQYYQRGTGARFGMVSPPPQRR